MSKIKAFREKIENEPVIGCFSKTTDSSLVEVMGSAKMDFVILDMEHGPITTETLKHHLMALQNSGTLGIVRVESEKSHMIGKALDLGAHGIQIPSVNDPEQARAAIKEAKFHPDGMRGVCRFVRAAEYSYTERGTYFKAANEALIILQLEGKKGLESFEEIIKVDGIDIIFVGPYDLSQSLGVPGEVEHPLVMKAIEDLNNKAAEKGIVLGTFCDTPEQLILRKNQGMKYLAYSVDLALFGDKLTSIKNSLV